MRMIQLGRWQHLSTNSLSVVQCSPRPRSVDDSLPYRPATCKHVGRADSQDCSHGSMASLLRGYTCRSKRVWTIIPRAVNHVRAFHRTTDVIR